MTYGTQRSVGSVAPTIVRAGPAENFAAASVHWASGAVSEDVASQFGRLVAEAASPIDDVRGTAVYRRHALRVLTKRALDRVLA